MTFLISRGLLTTTVPKLKAQSTFDIFNSLKTIRISTGYTQLSCRDYRICKNSLSYSWILSQHSIHHSDRKNTSLISETFNNELKQPCSILPYQNQNYRLFQTQSSDYGGIKLSKFSFGEKTKKFARKFQKSISKYDIEKISNKSNFNKEKQHLQSKLRVLKQEFESQNKQVQEEVKKRIPKNLGVKVRNSNILNYLI